MWKDTSLDMYVPQAFVKYVNVGFTLFRGHFMFMSWNFADIEVGHRRRRKDGREFKEEE